MKVWECDVCHYLTVGEQAPEECHVCHQGSSHFHQVIGWRCTVCGEIVFAVAPPAECPICHQSGDMFVEL